MAEESTLTLIRYFKEYYFRYSGRINEPLDIGTREFGYLPFGRGMIRHLSYKEFGSFRALLVKEGPAGVYCSNSYYREPSAEIQKKGWIKADLIFDIDADLLELPCKREHNVWLCKQCGKKDFGQRPQLCLTCNGNRILEFSWACPRCLEGSKKETFRLLDYLQNDFGISKTNIRVFFSGNAGYHVEVSNTSLEVLDQHERADLSDYLTAQGVLPGAFKSNRLSANDPGWRGRVARFIRDLPPNTAPFRTQDYQSRVFELTNELKEDQAEKIISLAISSNAIRMDTMVTTDIHRIFRMPETLNQKTGLVKRECRDLSTFDPITGAIALENETELIEVDVDICPKIALGTGTYGPFRNKRQKLPLYVAVYLIAKGAARVAPKIRAS